QIGDGSVQLRKGPGAGRGAYAAGQPPLVGRQLLLQRFPSTRHGESDPNQVAADGGDEADGTLPRFEQLRELPHRLLEPALAHEVDPGPAVDAGDVSADCAHVVEGESVATGSEG